MADLSVLSNGFPTLSLASLAPAPAGGAGCDGMPGDGGATAFLDVMTGQLADLPSASQSAFGQDPASTGKSLPTDAAAVFGAPAESDAAATTAGTLIAPDADPSLAWLMGASGVSLASSPVDRPSLVALAAASATNPMAGLAQADLSLPMTSAPLPASAPDTAEVLAQNAPSGPVASTDVCAAESDTPLPSRALTMAEAGAARLAWLRGLNTGTGTMPAIAMPPKSSDDESSADSTAQDAPADDAPDATRDPALACLLASPTQPVVAQALPGLPIASRAIGKDAPVSDVTAGTGAQPAPAPAGESRSGPTIPGAGRIVATPPTAQVPGTAAAPAIDPAPIATSTPAPAAPGMTTDATGAAAPADAVPQSSDGARTQPDTSVAARTGLAAVPPEAIQRGTASLTGRTAAAQPAMFALAGARRTQAGLATDAGSPTATASASASASASATLLQPADTVQGVTKPAESQQPSLDMAQSDWPQKMIDHIETLRDAANATDTSIRLKPDALGRIDVAIRDSGDGALSVRFTAEQPATRALLADAQPQLTAAAESRGIRLSGTSVDLAGSGMTGGQDRQRQQAPNAATANTSNTLATGGDDIAVDDDGRIA